MRFVGTEMVSVQNPQLNFLQSFFLPTFGISSLIGSSANINLNSDFLLTNINLGIGVLTIVFTRLMAKRGK